jgi:hypothetical protein
LVTVELTTLRLVAPPSPTVAEFGPLATSTLEVIAVTEFGTDELPICSRLTFEETILLPVMEMDRAPSEARPRFANERRESMTASLSPSTVKFPPIPDSVVELSTTVAVLREARPARLRNEDSFEEKSALCSSFKCPFVIEEVLDR